MPTLRNERELLCVQIAHKLHAIVSPLSANSHAWFHEKIEGQNHPLLSPGERELSAVPHTGPDFPPT